MEADLSENRFFEDPLDADLELARELEHDSNTPAAAGQLHGVDPGSTPHGSEDDISSFVSLDMKVGRREE